MYETNEIKLRRDGSIDTGYYMKFGRDWRSQTAHAATTGLFRRLMRYLAAKRAAKTEVGRLTHFDPIGAARLEPANDADPQVVNAYKFRGAI